MKITPKTVEELEREMADNLLSPGIYDFEVVGARERVSKAGNEMIELDLAVYTQDGRQASVRDWLMDSMGFKMRHFCEATGLIDAYEAGALSDDDCVGRAGQCKIRIDKGKKKDNGEYFRDKNGVADYVASGTPAAPPAARPATGVASGGIEDDIPF